MKTITKTLYSKAAKAKQTKDYLYQLFSEVFDGSAYNDSILTPKNS